MRRAAYSKYLDVFAVCDRCAADNRTTTFRLGKEKKIIFIIKYIIDVLSRLKMPNDIRFDCIILTTRVRRYIDDDTRSYV